MNMKFTKMQEITENPNNEKHPTPTFRVIGEKKGNKWQHLNGMSQEFCKPEDRSTGGLPKPILKKLFCAVNYCQEKDLDPSWELEIVAYLKKYEYLGNKKQRYEFIVELY